MKKKSITLMIALSLVCGCGETTQVTAQAEVEQSYSMERISWSDSGGNIEQWRDTETGVHYFIYDRTSGNGGMGGICPRYNADGSLYVTAP